MISNYYSNNKSSWNSPSIPSKKIDEHDKQSSLEEDTVRIIGTRPSISSHLSPIVQNIIIPKTNHFSEKRPDHDWQYRGQHDSLYYQPQPDIHNHRQHYCHDRRIQQSFSQNYYDSDKGEAHGMIHSGITTP